MNKKRKLAVRPHCQFFTITALAAPATRLAYIVSDVVMTSTELLLVSISLLSVQVQGLTDPSVPRIFFPFGTDVGDRIVPVGNDTSSPGVHIAAGAGFPFLYDNCTTVFVSIKV